MKSQKCFQYILQAILILIACILIFSMPQVLRRKHYSGVMIQPLILVPTESTSEFSLITPKNILDIQELSLLILDEDGAVLKLAENEKRNALQVVYQDGKYVSWDLQDGAVISSQQLFNNASGNTMKKSLSLNQLSAGLSFNRNGTVLIAPEDVLADRLGDYIYWDFVNHQRVQGSGGSQVHAVHPALDIVFFAGDTSVAMEYGLVSEPDGQFSGLFQNRDSRPTKMAIDPLGDFLAIANEAGCVTIGDISILKRDGPAGMLNPFRYKASYQCHNDHNKNAIATIDLEFDSTHSWLGWLTDENLVIWSLRNYVFPLYMKTELIGANVMSFDRTGQILAIGTADGIIIFDLTEKKEIAEYKVGDVTALYFTRDNRLLVWGDAQGVVHLLGVK